MEKKTFEIEIKDKKTKARTGLLRTKSGEIETPFFMPVATKTSVKHISSQDLEIIGAKAIISNSYILSLRPGTKVIKRFGGIAKFMNFSGINFTDSGGFQMYSKEIYLDSDKNGVIFRNPFNGKKVSMTPEKNMEIQLKLNADVAMCLDSMPLIEESKDSIRMAVEKTKLWALRCKKHHDKMQKDVKREKRQLLFGIIQGGIHKDLREKSAKEIKKINFDGYAIGGLALGEPKKDEYKMIEICKKIIPEEKIVYLMGAGEPLELLEAISRGVDIFDSRFPTQNARRGTLFTKKGRINLRNLKYKDDKCSIDEKCNCFTCKNYSKAYIRHLLIEGEGLGMRLASYHNLYFLQKLIENAREAIYNEEFKKFLNNFKKSYHPN